MGRRPASAPARRGRAGSTQMGASQAATEGCVFGPGGVTFCNSTALIHPVRASTPGCAICRVIARSAHTCSVSAGRRQHRPSHASRRREAGCRRGAALFIVPFALITCPFSFISLIFHRMLSFSFIYVSFISMSFISFIFLPCRTLSSQSNFYCSSSATASAAITGYSSPPAPSPLGARSAQSQQRSSARLRAPPSGEKSTPTLRFSSTNSFFCHLKLHRSLLFIVLYRRLISIVRFLQPAERDQQLEGEILPARRLSRWSPASAAAGCVLTARVAAAVPCCDSSQRRMHSTTIHDRAPARSQRADAPVRLCRL